MDQIEQGGASAVADLRNVLDPVVDVFHLNWEGTGVAWSADLWLEDGRHFRERGSTPKLALKRVVRSVLLGRIFREPPALAPLGGNQNDQST